MKNALKRSLSILLAITIIFSSAYVGLGELDYSGLFAFNPFKDLIVKSEAASETDLTFELNEDGQSYSVVSCNKNVSGEIVIPDTYNDLPVTSIDSYAFNYCQLITSVVIPDSVTSIGNSAFNRCTKLENVTIPEALISIGEGAFKCTNLTSVTIPDTVTTIGDEAFYDCASLVSITVNENNTSYSSVDGVLFNKEKTEIIHYPANKADEEYTIPNTVTSIGSYAFYNCKNITSVTIPDSVTRIYEYNFYTCTNLVSINVDENNAYFFSFDGVLFNKSKTNLINYPIGKTETEYTVPDGVTQISDNAFFNSANLISITIPDSVTSIGVDAFYGCKNLNVLNIEDIASWCAIDFIYDDEIGDFPGTYANPMLYAENLYLNGELVTDLVIPEGVTSISRNAFDGCTSITSVTIPESVTDIGRWAFNGCTNLNAVYITNITNWCNFGFNVSLEDDGGICDYFSNPLYYAKKLYLNGELVTDLIIPDGVTNIANGTFHNCDSLTSITIPDSVTSIEHEAFLGCSNLTSISLGNGVTTIGHSAFYNCTNLISVIMPESMTSIGGHAFYECTSLESITIPSGITTIDYGTFLGCCNLETVDIPNSVTSIEGDAFNWCTSLESIIIPDSVTSIGYEAFYYCKALKSVVIPASITEISYGAFSSCSALQNVFYNGSENEWANITIRGANSYLTNSVIHYNSTDHTYEVTVESVGSCTQNGVTHKECTVCGYTETIETSATGHDFVDGICTVCGTENTFEYSIENDTVTITGYTGTDTDIIIPSTIEGLPVTVISDSAFYNCDSITSVIIPDSVITLGSYAFDSCTNLSSVKISDNITSIEKYTFKYCSNLESVELGEGITKIDDCAFENCSKLSSIVFPDALTSIGYRAFGECSNLTSVSIPNNVETIGSAAFSMCTKLDSVTIGCGLTNIDGRAFSGCENLVSISVDEDNIAFSSSDGILFNKDKTVLIKYPEGKTNTAYIIPDSVISIGDSAFSGCDSLTTVVIPDNVASIGKYAFYVCNSLTSITIPNSVTNIGDEAFYYCRELNYVFYSGSESDWANITIGSSNESLTEATIHYGSTDHSYCDWVVESEAKCTENGSRYRTCSVCDYTETDVITALGHNYSTEWTIDKAATCTEDGSKSRHCSTCNEKVDIITIEATGHDYSDWTIIRKPSCTEDGFAERICNFCDNKQVSSEFTTEQLIDSSLYPESNHNYEDNCSETYEFSYKGAKGLVLTFSSSTYTESGYDYIYIYDETGTLYGKYSGSSLSGTVISLEGSSFGIELTSDGSVTKYGFSFDSIVAVVEGLDITNPLGHNYSTEWTIDKAATCTEDGSKSHHCSRCDDKADVTVITATGHNYVDGYCTYCDSCTAFEYTVENNAITITGYKGKRADVVIPSEIDGLPVVVIGDDAFYNCESIISVTIPNSVTSIGDYAFRYCYNIASIIIPNSVTSIGDYAFYYCENLTSVTIPDSVTSIGDDAFYNCENLTSINVSENNPNYSSVDGVLYNKAITVLYLLPLGKTGAYIMPDTVTSYHNDEIFYDSRITSLHIGSSFEAGSKFDPYEFAETGECNDIPLGVLFGYCSMLSEITVSQNNPYYSAEDGILYNKDKNELVFAPVGKKGIITVPQGVTAIHPYAFIYSNASIVVLPETIDLICSVAFVSISPTTIIIPSNVDCIMEDALLAEGIPPVIYFGGTDESSFPEEYFEYSQEIEEEYGLKPFNNELPLAVDSCNGFDYIVNRDSTATLVRYNGTETTVTIPAEIDGYVVSEIYPTIFGLYVDFNTEIKIPTVEKVIIEKGITEIPIGAFANCLNLSEIQIPDSVITIGAFAFGGCESLTEIIIPDSVTSIGKDAFIDCYGLTSINVDVNNSKYSSVDGVLFNKDKTVLIRYPEGKTDTAYIIPDSVTSIGDNAFYCCTNLTSITIPDNVTNIGDSAFRFCNYLTSVTLGNGVTNIGNRAFYSCGNLTSITIPDSVINIGNYAFAFCYNLTSIIIPDGVTSIGDNAFYSCDSLTSIVIPDSVTSIGDNAFHGCDSLTSITIPDSVTCIGDNAFYSCDSLTLITIPDSVTSIGSDAFYGTSYYNDSSNWENDVLYIGNHLIDTKTSLSGEFIIKSGTKTIAGSAFDDCDSLTSIVIPDSVTSIGDNAFHGCDSLTSITIPDSVTSIGDYAFYYCNNLTDVFYGGTEDEWSAVTIGDGNDCLTNATIHFVNPHTYGDWVVTLEPTCTEDGVQSKTCSDCGDVVTEVIEALGHDYSKEWTIDKAATCTTDGSKSHHCSRCDSKTDVTVITATGHIYSDWVTYREPTCTVAGSKHKTCSVCQNVITESIDALGHDYSTEWTTDKEATCTEDGSKSHHCSRCDSKADITVIPATNHNYSDWVVTSEPTCTEEGSKKQTCSNCGDVVTEVIDSLGHDYSGEWTIDKAATCTTDGSKSRHCSRCNDKTDITVITATGHVYGDWVTDREPNCTVAGSKHKTCSVCQNVVTESIEALGHDYSSEWTIDKAATCTTDGSKSRHCSRCDSKTDVTVITATGHLYGDWIIDTEATVLSEGAKHRICSVCSYEEAQVIEKVEIDIETNTDYGLAVFTVVHAQTLEPISGAQIFISTENDGENTFTTDSNGQVSVILPVGKQVVSAYAEGCLTRNLRINVKSGVNEIPQIGLSDLSTYDAEITSKLMTIEEIEAAGIDTNDPDNQHVYKYELKLEFEAEIDWYSFFYYMNDVGEIVGGGSDGGSGGYWVFGGNYTGGSGGYFYIPATEERESVSVYPVSEYFYLIIRGEVRWLKEMFDVEMLVINNSLTDTLEDLTATLELPEGLSLAKMVGEQQSLIQEIDHISEGESKSVHWYVRGDKEGSYNLEARLQGTIMPFEEEIDDLFVAENQLQVLAGSALSLHFEFPDAAYYGEDYPITITLTNTSDRTLYNISHMIQVEQGMVVYYSDGTSKEKVDTSTLISSGVIREFNPGDKIIIEGSVNIFFKSEMIERELEKYIGLIDGIEQLINGYKAVTAAFDIFKFLDNCVTGCTKAMDDFIASAAESSDELDLFKELHDKLSSLYTSYSTTGNKTFDAAIDLVNTGLNGYLNAITEDPDVWFATHSAEDIKALLADIEALENSIIAPKQPTKKFDIFDSLRTAISAIPIRFALKNVIITEDENNTTSIPWSYSTTKAGPQYFGVSNVSKYMISLVQMIGAEAYEASMPGIFMAIPGVDDPFNKDEAIKYIQATENEIAQFKAKDATGEVAFRAWVERNEASTYSLRKTSVSDDFLLECDNETATYEDGVLTFTGDGMISVTPQSQTGGTLYIEDSAGNLYTYVIDVVEQHTCECGEREVVVSPTAEFDGFAVKSCTVCSEIMEVEVLAYDNCCVEHTFAEWVEDERESCTDSTLRSRCCSVCGFTETEVVSGTSHKFVDGVCSECGIENSDESLFDYEITGDSVTITDCEITNGEVVIPDEINGLPVTEIGPSAFEGSEDITSIVIPDSVTNIGDSAFENCDSLEYIFYPGTESDWENISIGDNNSAITDAIIHYGSTDHTYVEKIDVEATCTEDGSKHQECSICGYCLEPEVIPALGHEYSSEWTIDVEPTCTEDGSKSHHCSRCDSKIDVTVIAATGHIYGEWNVTSEPTCTEEGSQSKICSACDVAVTEAIEALGHSYSTEWTIDVEATCTEDGSKSHHCSRCDSKIDVTVISAKHSYSDWVIDNEATCTQDGKKHRICSACGNIETKNILATGHNFVNSYCTTCGVEEAFKYSIDNGCVTIIGYNGRNPYPYRWDVVIPSEIEGFPVVTIGSRAFRSTGINNVTIPNSVTSIEELAFYNCNSLTSVTIGNSVSNIGAQAFDSCIYLTDVIIPDSVTNIGHHAFNSCDRLTSISIPDSVTSIGDYAFNSCDRLATVTIGNGVTSIGNNAFNYCRNLAMVTIGNSVKSIGDYAFGSCENLVSITIPNSVTSIGDSAFSYCYSLTSITIPDSVITLGDSAFNNCINLTSITIGNGVTSIGNHTFWNCRKLSSIIIPYNVTSIGDYVFSHCDSLDYVFYPGSKSEWDSITLGSSNDLHTNAIIHYNSTDHIYGDWIIDVEPTCTEDGEKHHVCSVCNYSESAVAGAKHSYSDGYCTVCGEEQLFEYSIENDCVTITGYLGTDTDVIIPATIEGLPVTTISDAFRNCSTITSICVPETVTSIGNFAFYGCTSLTTIELPSGLTKINYRSFGNCDSLTSIVIPDGVTCIDYYAFDSCANLTSVTIPDSVTTIGESAFYNCEKLSSVEIGNGITNIENGAFRYCISLTDVYIKDISAWCNIDFATYDSTPLHYAQNLYVNGELLTDLIIPGNVTSIKNYAFYSCESIVSVKISNSVINIGAWAFNDCTKLELVVISDSVTDIDETAFRNCPKMHTIYVGEDNKNYSSDNGVLFNKNKSSLIKYPANKSYFEYIIPDTITTISKYAFNNSDIKAITIPENVTTIDDYAFKNCTSLTNVYYLGLLSDWDKISIGSNNECLTNANISHLCTLGDWVIDSEATCTEDGSRSKTCKVCGEVVTETIEAIGHNYSDEWTIDTEATCTTPGSKSHHCTVCDDKTDITVIVSGGHNYVVTDALSVHPHTTSYKCSYCEDEKTEAPVIADCIECNYKITLIDSTDYKLVSYIGAETDVLIPATYEGSAVTTIANSCFKGNSSIRTVEIEEGVTTIGSLAFMNCTSLEIVYIPASVTSIGTNAFFGFTGTIYCAYGSTAHKYAIANKIDCIIDSTEELETPIQETEDTEIDFNNFVIFTNVKNCSDITEILGLSESATVIPTASCMNGNLELYGTGTIITVFDGNDYIGDFTLIVEGDLNGDSVCNVLDAFEAERASNGHIDASTEQIYAANGMVSDEIDASSYQNVVNKALAS